MTTKTNAVGEDGAIDTSAVNISHTAPDAVSPETAGAVPPEPTVPPIQPEAQPEESCTPADDLISIGTNAELFHSPEGTAYATYKINGIASETVLVESKRYGGYLLHAYYKKFGKPPSKHAVENAISYLRAKAVIDGAELPVYVRVAPDKDGVIYYDLCDKERRVVRITGKGWDIIQEPPVKFVRYGGMAAQTVPIKGGSISELWDFLNIDERDRVLVLAWLLQALRPVGPYPVLIEQGGQGTGKSLFARLLRMLSDPSTALLRTLPDNTRDLLITARNSWTQTYDNISELKDEFSDDFCRMSTGGGISPRQLYTDTDQIIIDLQRPVILNGITTIATRPDLQERAIMLQLLVIPKEKRKSERVIMADFQKVRCKILGALFDMVSAAIKNLPNVVDNDLPRMADFTCWVKAAQTATCFPAGDKTFEQRYNESLDEAVRLQIENDSLATAVCKFMESERKYTGTTKALLDKLSLAASVEDSQAKFWPTTRTLKNRLMRLQGPLLTVGIRYEFLGHLEGGSSHTLTWV